MASTRRSLAAAVRLPQQMTQCWPMDSQMLITLEILLTIVAPLIFLYLKGTSTLRYTVSCLLSLPVVWYLTYSPLHELSHVAGTYLVGGRVTYVKLIPSFWSGEFARAWITTDGITENWQQLILTSSPYVLDVACVAAGMVFLRRDRFKSPFFVGFVFMFLCLRPTFDLVCETIAFLLGDRGDVYHIAHNIGSFMTWSFCLLSIGLSLFSILWVLKRFVGFPNISSMAAT